MGNNTKSEKSLKAQNLYLLGIFIVFNIFIFIAVILEKNLEFENLNNIWAKLTIKDGLLAAIVPLLSIILNGIISSNFKAKLVFWRFKNPLPGSRAFSILAKKDPRINLDNLNKQLVNQPKSAEEENVAFYRLYKKFENKLIVKDSHKQFLLTRDLTGYSFLFLILFLLAIYFVNASLYLKTSYLGYLIIQFIIISIVARNYGNRFVCNVLAEASIV